MFFKYKKYNVVNFGEGCWGADFFVDKFNKKTTNIHGWFPSKKDLKKGTLILKEKDNYTYAAYRIKDIQWLDDPTDMFFAEVTKCSHVSQFTYKELTFIINVLCLRYFE